MKKILLAGGNGFIGSHLARALSATSTIRTYDRPGSRFHGIGEFVPGEVSSKDEFADALRGCDSMIYLIHESGASPFLDSENLALVRNIELLTQAVASCEAAGVENIALFSSGGAVYGKPDQIPVSESHPLRPISAYGVAKASMEMYLNSVAATRGFKTLILRPSNPFGPGQNPLRKQGAIAVFIHKILCGEQIDIWGDGSAVKDYIFIEDMTSAIAQLVDAGFDGKAYNIGSGEGQTLTQILSAMAEILEREPAVQYHPARSNDVQQIVLNTSALRDRTGWRPEISFRAGVERTAKWIMENF